MNKFIPLTSGGNVHFVNVSHIQQFYKNNYQLNPGVHIEETVVYFDSNSPISESFLIVEETPEQIKEMIG